jgi:glycosyltransferase involved in cell wall biosynthesis
METEQCGWWIDIGVEPLANALQKAMSLSDAEREAMGSRGRRWVSRCFSWSRVALEMRAVYEWILTGGAPPAPIRLT